MIQLETKLGCRLLLVELPDNASIFSPQDIKIDMGYMIYKAYEKKKKWLQFEGMPGARLPGLDYHERSNGGIKLPPGTYEFIATTDTLTEEQAADLMERQDKGYPDCNPYNDRMYVDSAVISFRTAVDQSGAEPTKTYAILKQLP